MAGTEMHHPQGPGLFFKKCSNLDIQRIGKLLQGADRGRRLPMLNQAERADV